MEGAEISSFVTRLRKKGYKATATIASDKGFYNSASLVNVGPADKQKTEKKFD